MENEIWKSVKFTNGVYEISNLGRLRRGKPGFLTWVGRIMKPQKNIHGYKTYTMIVGKKHVTKPAHRLVSDAFLGKRKVGYCTNHKNGDKFDSRLQNIENVTFKQNKHHSLYVLKKQIGEDHGNSFLTENDVKEIRDLPKKYGYRKILCEKFKISKTWVSAIRMRQCWTHV